MTSCLHYPGCEHWPPDQARPTRRSVAPLPEEERNQWGPAAARRWFELRDRVAGCEPRYRLASAIGDVAGFGSKDYSALTNLVNLLKAHPEDAKPTAVWQRAEFSEESVTRSAAMVRRVLAALNGIEHEAPAELLDALAAYPPRLRGAGSRASTAAGSAAATTCRGAAGGPLAAGAPALRSDGGCQPKKKGPTPQE